MKTRSPGKLILSGEHAVVYGKPALAVAIDRFFDSTIEPSQETFEVSVFGHSQKFSLGDAKDTHKEIANKYRLYLNQKIPIENILQSSDRKNTTAAINLIKTIVANSGINKPVKIALQSNIPIGCGLGSSAALITNLLYALQSYNKQSIDDDQLCKTAIELENYQHGKSSGLDITTSYSGGGILYQRGNFTRCQLPNVSTLHLIDTGTPESSTGACVEYVAKHFANKRIWGDFQNNTLELYQALHTQNQDNIKFCIQKNHELLCKIQVVPKTVQSFIQSLASASIAAKTCGAGSIAGNNAGIVLAITDDTKTLKKICNAHNYNILSVNYYDRGTHNDES